MTLGDSEAVSSFSPSSMPARRSFASLFAAKRVDEWSSDRLPAYTQSAAVVAEEKFSDLKLDMLMMQLERHLSDASCYSTDNDSTAEDSVSPSNSASMRGDADDEADEAEIEEECKSAPAADDHIEEFVEEIQPVESALSWNDECDEQDDCTDDDEAADLFDECISNLHTVSALYSRKSLRASSASTRPTRISPSALHHMSSRRSALSAACAKTAPIRANPDLAAHNRNLRPSRSALADQQAEEAVAASKQLTGSSIGPYGTVHKRHTTSRSLLVHQARLEIAQREAAAMKKQLIEQRNAASSSSSPRKMSTSASTAAVTAPAAPSMPKALARACASAARRLPQVLQECRDPRWQAVLQAREVSKIARKAAKASRPERGGQCSRTRKHTPPQSQPSVVVQDMIADANRARKDSAKVSRHGTEKVVARELKALKSLSKSKATPAAAPLAASTLIRSTVAARWVAAHPTTAAASTASASDATPAATAHARLPSKSKRAFQLKAAQRKAAALKAAGISEPVVAATAVVAAVKKTGTTNHALLAQQYEQRASEAFNTWRKGFYHGNQARLERPFVNATATKIHLANVAPHVQRAFMARLRSNTSSGGAFVTFHGTNAANIPSILRHGFLVPGRPSKAPASAPSTASAAAGKRNRSRAMVRVVNGSSFGCGVYSSTTADYSLGYCRGTTSMFICAVINSRSGAVRRHSNIVVSFDETHIVPLFLLDFTHGAPPPPPRPPAVTSPSVVAARNRAKRAGEQQARADERRIRDRMTDAPSKDMLRQMLRETHSRMIRSATLSKQTMVEGASSS